MTGILSVCSHDARVLYDPGSTHSYVSSLFASQFGKDPVLLDHSFYVATPVGESLLVKYVHKSCEIFVADRKTIANLIVLDLLEFDVILGMDWLAAYHATLDCHLKMVKFDPPGEPFFMVQGDRSVAPYNIISALGARKLLRKGCQGFLALVRDVEVQGVDFENVPVVNEFSDVFPEELPGLLPERDIEFCIDLVPNTQPISIPPYAWQL